MSYSKGGGRVRKDRRTSRGSPYAKGRGDGEKGGSIESNGNTHRINGFRLT